MKRNHILAAVLVLLLTLCVAACANAADVRPLEPDHNEIDLTNGTFCLTVKDADRITDGGYFTAALYLEDHYDKQQIEALAAGDTVLINGQPWTVQEVIPHPADELEGRNSYEIYTEEENVGYIVFIQVSDGCYFCVINDWSPVSPVGDVRVMLPLPDRFEYYRSDDDLPKDMDELVNDLEGFGNTFVAYNTTCRFEDGVLVSVTHSPYPQGPVETPDDTVEAVEPDAADEAKDTSDAIPVWKFCHGVREGLETAVIKGYQSDCEEGPFEIEVTPEEAESIRDIAINGVITGKANDLSVTGGTWFYTFETPEGKHLLTIELYKGLIVDSATGMYNYSK